MKKTTYKKKNDTKVKVPKKTKVQKEIERIEKQKLELTNVYKYKGVDKTKAKIRNNAKIAKYEAEQLKLKYKKGTLAQKLLIIFMFIMIFCLTIGILFTVFVIINSPKFDTTNLYSKEASVLLDKNGNEFARLGTENRELVNYEELPQVLVDAIVATEDSRYFQHNGVDLARFTKAVIGQLMGRSDAGGGSTLTMQVVKNTYTSTVSGGIEGIIRKFTDIYMAVFKVERSYTQELQILCFIRVDEENFLFREGKLQNAFHTLGCTDAVSIVAHVTEQHNTVVFFNFVQDLSFYFVIHWEPPAIAFKSSSIAVAVLRSGTVAPLAF